MKKQIKVLGFSFRLLYRRISHQKIRFSILILNMTFLLMMLTLLFSTRDLTRAYYFDLQASKYLPYNLTIETDTNANARFYSLSHLKQDDIALSHIEHYFPVFESQMLMTYQSTYAPVKMMAGSLSDLRALVPITYVHHTLGVQDVIITQSLALKHNLVIGDVITLHVGNQQRTYTIVEITMDYLFFSGETLFVHKPAIIQTIFSEIYPSAPTYSDTFYMNLSNMTYIHSTDLEFLLTHLRSQQAYSSLLIEPTLNFQAMEDSIQKNTVIFQLMMSIIGIAIMFVMFLTFKMYVETRHYEDALYHLFGSSKALSIRLNLMEMLFLMSISFLMSYWLSNALTAYTLSLLQSNAQYTTDISAFIKAILVGLLLLAISFILVRNYKASSLNQKIKHHKPFIWVKKGRSIFWILVFLIGITLLWGILDFFFESSFFMMLMLITMLLTVIHSLIAIFALWYQKSSIENSYGLFIRLMLQEKSYIMLSVILLVVGISILLLSHTNRYLDHRMHAFEQEYQMDFIMTNFSTSPDLILSEIQSTYENIDIDKAYYFRNVSTSYADLGMLISMDASRLATYFNVQIADETIHLLNTFEQPGILLPMKYQKVYQLNMGDTLQVRLNALYPEVSFVVLGFFEKTNQNLAFIHHGPYSELSGLGYNALFVKTDDDAHIMHQALLSNYSQHMVHTIMRQDIIRQSLHEMRQLIQLINIVVISILIAFFISILMYISTLFLRMKPYLSHMHLLGHQKKHIVMYAFKESLFSTTMLCISALAFYLIFMNYMSRLLILIGEYEAITNQWGIAILGVLMTYLLIFVPKMLYFFKIHGIKDLKTRHND